MSVRYVKGDATTPVCKGPCVIPHCCNDVGAFGSGFAGALNRRWKEPRESYLHWYRMKTSPVEITRFSSRKIDHFVPFELGNVIFVEVRRNLWVANIIGQHGTIKTEKTPIRYTSLGFGLETVAHFCKEKDATAHMPKLGSGLAGGCWDVIEEMILSIDMDATVYLF